MDFTTILHDPVAVLSLVVVVVLISALLYGAIKLLSPIIKHFKLKLPGGSEIEWDGKDRRSQTTSKQVSCSEEEELVMLSFHLTKRTLMVDREIEAEQQDLLNDQYMDFIAYMKDYMRKHEGSDFDPDRAWWHVHSCLTASIKNNHFIQIVDADKEAILDPLYIEKKVAFVRHRFGSIDIQWTVDLETSITVFIRKRIISFARVAKEKMSVLIADLDAHGLSNKREAITTLLSVLKKEIGAKFVTTN